MHNPFRPILAGRALDGCRFMAEAKNVVDSIHHRIGRAISESKALIDAETLPDNEQLLAPYQAFFGSVARLTSRRHQARAIESCSTCIATYSKRLRR
jgi:hypothetical protein